jgi:D-alanyl-lipoteichoic acid acyltransferase DltB (MBOAT superfamily)
MKVRNTFIIFLVSGFWHGANWTFIAWGALNAIYFLPLLLMKKNRDNLETVAQGRKFPNIREMVSMLVTFGLTCFAWIFFRAQDMHHAFAYIGEIFSSSLFTVPNIVNTGVGLGLKGMAFFLVIFLLFEWFNREHKFALASMGVLHRYRYAVFYFLVLSIIYSSGFNQAKSFIYFQF